MQSPWPPAIWQLQTPECFVFSCPQTIKKVPSPHYHTSLVSFAFVRHLCLSWEHWWWNPSPSESSTVSSAVSQTWLQHSSSLLHPRQLVGFSPCTQARAPCVYPWGQAHGLSFCAPGHTLFSLLTFLHDLFLPTVHPFASILRGSARDGSSSCFFVSRAQKALVKLKFCSSYVHYMGLKIYAALWGQSWRTSNISLHRCFVIIKSVTLSFNCIVLGQLNCHSDYCTS